MLRPWIPLCLASLLLSACQQQQGTCITSIADLPLKDTKPPAFEWQSAPLRANAQYILCEANGQTERAHMLGDYYFLRWYDAEPQKPVRIVMKYTQAKTGPEVQERVIEHREARRSRGERREKLFFNGPERAEKGDILSWRMELYCDGVLKDSRQSYLWK
ncbi:MAG: hypothetical protein MJ051_04790 [Akkermansia sp.]|nr:hypothetical protein [Akkermansia sp.]